LAKFTQRRQSRRDVSSNTTSEMKNLFGILIIFIISSLSCWGQKNIAEEIDKERRLEFAKSDELKKIQNIFSRESITLTEFESELGLKIKFRDSSYVDLPPRSERQDSTKWYFQYQVWRNLDFNVSQLVRGVITTKFWFDFNLLVCNDTIIGVKVSEGGRDLYYHIFEKEFNIFIKEHESLYKTKITDYKGELGPFNFDYYGTYFGIHQSLLKDCRKMINAFENENKSILRKWLISMNPEKQAYAIQGFYYLEKYKGINLTKEEQILINHIKNLNRTIHVNSMVQTSELLNDEYFEKVFMNLKERGYLKVE